MNRLAGHGVLISTLRGKLYQPFKSDVRVGRKQLEDMGAMDLQVEYSGGVIDAMHFLSTSQSPMSQRTMIFFPGMGDAYERFGIWGIAEENLLLQYQRAGFNVILWNYPDVINSTGSPSLHNITEAAAAIIRLLIEEYKVPEKDLLIHAHSMGGGIATYFVTQRDAEGNLKYPEISLCNDRSFSSLKKAIKCHTDALLPIPSSKIGELAGKFVSDVCKWNLATIEVWNPPDARGYYWCIHNISDVTIPHKASLAYALRKQDRDTDRIIELSPYNEFNWGTEIRNYNELHSSPCHDRPLYRDEWEQQLIHLRIAFPDIASSIDT